MSRFGYKFIIVLTLAFLYIPIAVLIALSFNESRFPTNFTGFSLQWYQLLFSSGKSWKPLMNTLIVAGSSALIASVVGTALAMGLRKLPHKQYVAPVFQIPMVIPDIVLGVSLLVMFTALKVKLGLHSIVLSHVVFNLAFVASVVSTKLHSMDESLSEASYDLGASKLRTFLKVELPELFPAIVAGALLAFTLSFDEFVIAFFTAGTSPDAQTLSMYIYSKIRFGITPDINALASITIAFSILLVIASQRINANKEKVI